MSTKKATKRALLTSILAICLCLVMLIGSTFAWFTDTASTGVNKIQSGTLDMDIVDANGNSLDGGTLSFRNKNGSDDILWEPGATFKLDTFKIVNKGNLALKYTVTITGAVGDAELLDAIDFTVQKGAATATELKGWDGILLPEGKTATAGTTEEVKETSEITIIGTMKKDAGNKYMDKTLTGIAITVNATQYTYENDSFGNTYDANADMTPDNLDKTTSANVTGKMPTEGNLALENESKTVTAVVPAGAAAANAEVTLTVVPQLSNVANVTIDAGKTFQAYDVQVTGLKNDNTEKVKVTLFVGAGLTGVKVFHNAKEITAAYDSTKGTVTFETASFSPFTVVYNTPAAMIGDVAYDSLTAAIAAVPEGGTEATTIKLMKSSSGSGLATKDGYPKNIVIDFNGYTYTMDNPAVGSSNTESQAMHWCIGSTIVMKNGTFAVATGADQAKMAMQSHTTAFTAENMKFDFTYVRVSNYGENEFTGTFAVYNGKECPLFCNNGGVMTLTNCVVTLPAASTCGIATDEESGINGKTILNGCTVNGGMSITNVGSSVTLNDTTITGTVKSYFADFTVVENNGTYTIVAAK